MKHGMNYRLYQLLWYNVSMELENGQSVYGRIIYVGSNFVELLLPGPKKGDADDVESSSEEVYEIYGVDENRHHKIGKTLIFSIERIVSIKTDSY